MEDNGKIHLLGEGFPPDNNQISNAIDLEILSSKKGYYILSTSRGIKTHIEAKKQHMGGELLCVIW